MRGRSYTFKQRLFTAAVPVLWMMGGYYATQRMAWRPIWWLDIGALEEWVPFKPNAVWIYGTFHAWFLLPFFVLRNRPQIRRYAWAFFWVATISIGIFVLFPTGVVRPEIAGDIPWPYHLCRQLDLPRNGFPSLHASITVLSAAFLHRASQSLVRASFWRTMIWMWVAAICWSCIALRQHVALDVLGGILIGVAAAWIAVRPPAEPQSEQTATASA
ncbi:MAG: phosphatase PAP2 family protein [Verrucomicrobiales bacterium]